jgi:hypothetical protein
MYKYKLNIAILCCIVYHLLFYVYTVYRFCKSNIYNRIETAHLEVKKPS